MVKNIRAWTMFKSQDQKEYPYEIRFSIDTQTGALTFQSKKSKIRLRLYMLLDLLEDVYSAVAPHCIEKKASCRVSFYNEYPDINFNPILMIAGSRIYWLNSFIDPKLINNPDCLTMTRWIHNIPENTPDKLQSLFLGKNRRRLFSGWKWKED